MKRIGIVLSVLLVCFFIKFSRGNLTDSSFFLKIGCVSENREYSLFVETGAVQQKTAQLEPRFPLYQPLSPSLPAPVTESVPPIPVVQSIPTDQKKEEDLEEQEFASATTQLENQRIELNRAIEKEEKKELQNAIASIIFEIEESLEADFQTEAVFADVPIGTSLFHPTVFESIAYVDLENERFDFGESPNTEQELAAVESELRLFENLEILYVFSQDFPELSPFNFEDANIADSISTYNEVPPQEWRIEIVTNEIQIDPELEIWSSHEAPSTQQEFAAAESDARRVELPIELAIAEMEEPKEAEKSMGFGDAAIADQAAPYAEFIPETRGEFVAKESEPQTEWAQFEMGDFQEVPNTDQELASAESDARIVELPIELAIGEMGEPKELEKRMGFGDAAIADQVAPYAELIPETRGEFAAKEIEPHSEWVQFEMGDFEEVPNTEQELAAAESDARRVELPIELAIGEIEEPKEVEKRMGFGDAVIADRIPFYSKPVLPETKTEVVNREIHKDIEKVVLEFETSGGKEAPNIEQEFANAESDLKKADEENGNSPLIEPVKVELAQAPTQEEAPSWFKQWIQSKQEAPAYGKYGDSADSSPSFWPKKISVQHTWGDQEQKCIPFATNYTTLELLFAPKYHLGHMMPLLDLRGHRFDNNTYAANAGIGGRYIPNPASDKFCEILGFNAYYDYRQGCIGYFNQLGAGIEILGSRWDLRANAYVPFGKKRHLDTYVYDDYEGDYYATLNQIESISYSFNGELGCLLIKDWGDFSLYAAAGPYFIARAICNDGVVGAEARLRPQYKDYLALDMSWRYDQLFDTIWQVEVIFTLPLYQISNQNKHPCQISDRQIYQPIQRFEVMPLSKRNCWYTNY